MSEEFDFESIKNKAIEQLKAGKPLLGKDGAFAPLLERMNGNCRNKRMQKQVQTSMGEVTVFTPHAAMTRSIRSL